MRGVVLDGETLGPGLDLTPLLEAADDWHWYDYSGPDAIAERVGDADVVVTNKAVVDDDAFTAAPRLQLVAVAATGVDNIDLAAARAHGVTVCNAVDYATPAVVQHTFALMLALATRLEDYHAAVRSGAWSRARQFCLLDPPITELAGRTLGIIGHGTLGGAVARAAPAFGMTVIVAARPGSAAVPAGRVALDRLLAEADVVSLHCPLTPETRGLVGADELAAMKPSGYVINTARGGIVDEPALAEALRAGRIAGAGVDVLSEEPPRGGNPLLAADIPNLVVTPHCAWGTHAARQRLVGQLGDVIAAFRAGEPLNVVLRPEAE